MTNTKTITNTKLGRLLSPMVGAAAFLCLGTGSVWSQEPLTAPSSVTAYENPFADFVADEGADAPRTLATDSAPGNWGRMRNAWQGFQNTMNPEIAFIADFAAAWYREQPQIGGAHDPNGTGLHLQQLELALGASVDPYFRLDGNIVFLLSGVEVEEIYATSLAWPQIQLRIGQFLHRFGRLNNTHPHSWAFVDQAFLLTRIFGGEGGRGLGVEASWSMPLPWFADLVIALQPGTGTATNRSWWNATAVPWTSPLNLLAVGTLKQSWSFNDEDTLIWGLSVVTGQNYTGRDNHTTVYATDLYFKHRPIDKRAFFEWQTEFAYRVRQVPNDALVDATMYSYIRWQSSQRFATALRYEWGTAERELENSALTAAYRADSNWTETRQRVAANFTYWPTEFTRFRLQANLDDTAQYSWNPGILLAAEFNIGAHGAHNF